jgi:hypothetical protein
MPSYESIRKQSLVPPHGMERRRPGSLNFIASVCFFYFGRIEASEMVVPW